MTEPKRLKVFVKGNTDLIDVVAGASSGGEKLVDGVAERVSARYPGIAVELTVERSTNAASLRAELESGDAAMLDVQPDVVLLSIADEVGSVASDGTNPEEAVQKVREDLVAVIESIKDKVGAHVLIANASTADPADLTFNFHTAESEPVRLRIQRLDLMLVGLSHDEGVSIVDTDRLIAEIGSAEHVVAATDYDAVACARIADEIVRILEDYGFFDDRPVMAQVGARKSKGAA